jgi:hypothetical protein
MHTSRCAVALLVVGLVTACGGGGGEEGGGEPRLDYQVSFGEVSVEVSGLDTGTPARASIDVTFSPDLQPGDAVHLFQLGTAFELGGLSTVDLGGGHYRAELPLAAGLPAGVYRGELLLVICPGTSCAQPRLLSRSGLPYTATVHRVGAPVVTHVDLEAFGLAWDDEVGRVAFLAFEVAPALAATPAVRVADGGGLFPPGPVEVQRLGTGSYQALLPYPDAVAAGTYLGSVTLVICEDEACTLPLEPPEVTTLYEVHVFHVATGLPPLTATFTVGGAAAPGVVEGLDGTGARTYALPAHPGQVIGVFPSQPAMAFSYEPAGADLAFLDVPFAEVRLQVGALPPGVTAGSATVGFRVEDGRWMYLTVEVTP